MQFADDLLDRAAFSWHLTCLLFPVLTKNWISFRGQVSVGRGVTVGVDVEEANKFPLRAETKMVNCIFLFMKNSLSQYAVQGTANDLRTSPLAGCAGPGSLSKIFHRRLYPP
jgi:hypothetical protein